MVTWKVIRWTNSAYKICGQLIAYATALHHSQFRVFSFGVILFGEMGRLLRWDRSGVVYTEAFQWKTQPDTLCEFFWRLNFLSPVDRGYDTTITRVMDDDDEAKAALSKLRSYEGWKDGDKLKITNLYRFLVRDDCATDGQLRSYITPGAIWDTNALFGRCTFGYIAYDVATSKLVPGRRGEWCPGRPCVEPYVHYRLVLETLGQPLNTFKSTRQLCEVIRDGIVGKEWSLFFTFLLTEGSRQLTLRRTRELVYYIGTSALETF
jgi:hypothetical protein